MARYDALSRSSRQADQMTAASLGVRERASGAGAAQQFLGAAQGAQNLVAGAQEMQIRQQEAATRAAFAEIEAQEAAVRTAMLHNEADLRERLAPLSLLEAQTRLGVLQTQKQIREMEAEDAEYQRSFRVIGGEGSEQVYHNGKFVPYDPENPLMQEAVMRRRQAMAQQSAELRESEADIRVKRSQTVKNLREPEATGSTARAGVMRTYKEMFEEFSRQAADDRLDPEQRAEATGQAEFYADQLRGMTAADQGGSGIDPQLAQSIAAEVGGSPEEVSRVLAGLAMMRGITPRQIEAVLLMGGPEAEAFKTLLQQNVQVRSRR